MVRILFRAESLSIEEKGSDGTPGEWGRGASERGGGSGSGYGFHGRGVCFHGILVFDHRNVILVRISKLNYPKSVVQDKTWAQC